jgi:hypothetical protein
VRLNTSYAGTGSSPVPLTAGTRGRATGTSRPPLVTDPASVQCRVAVRSVLPARAAHRGQAATSINGAFTYSPPRTARDDSPSRRSAVISLIATVTCCSAATAVAADAVPR